MLLKPVFLPDIVELLLIEILLDQNFRQKGQANAPCPNDQVDVLVMPNSHESKHDPHVDVLHL